MHLRRIILGLLESGIISKYSDIKINGMRILSVIFFLSLLWAGGCKTSGSTASTTTDKVLQFQTNPFEAYLAIDDPVFEWHVDTTYQGEGYQTHIIRLVSQNWLTEEEVKDPTWWHWVSVYVPEQVSTDKGLLYIGGGNRGSDRPKGDNQLLIKAALATNSVTVYLHNIPNQPLEFVGDDFGPRVEDELISYGWKKFLEGGAQNKDAIWLARLPMTKGVIRTMDVVTDFTANQLEQTVDRFVVAGGSKRGWTTWTTAAMDDRVIAIAPLVIDLLNVITSFEHHWQVYGKWADAVGDYQREGIMEWQGSKEYSRLMELTEPYSYRDRYQMPKFIINSTGDQFFLPDSWKFYWDQLPGEKHLRYIPNTDHSMRNTDATESLIAFYQDIVNDTPRPDFEWRVENGALEIEVDPERPPAEIKLWQAHNPDARNFQLKTIGEAFSSTEVPLEKNGRYRLKIDNPEEGYSCFFAELFYENGTGLPLKFTTGVVVTPDTYPFDPFSSKEPMGTPR